MKRPRNLMLNPKNFGKEGEVIWITKHNLEEIAGAQFQHYYCLAMRKAINSNYASVKDFCSIAKISYQRLAQVLRGDTVITATDIGVASVFLNLPSDLIEIPSCKLAGDSSEKNAIGAFYTPDEVALYMAKKIYKEGQSILEPSFGDGSFLRALKSIPGFKSKILACEIDSSACQLVVSQGLLNDKQIFPDSFFNLSTSKKFNAVIGNPPYVRLRNLSEEERRSIISCGESILGSRIGEESSEWMPFLLKSIKHLEKGGSLALVLPFDFTYVKYARRAWEYLGNSFKKIEVLRSKERIFKNILQDVILLIAHDKGQQTNTISYKCFHTRDDLLSDKPGISSKIKIESIVAGERSFQKALISNDVIDVLNDSHNFTKACEEVSFHIGYVCGNKNFFHPNNTTIKRYKLPSRSLHPTIVSSKQLSLGGFRTSELNKTNQLWLPSEHITSQEEHYILFGENEGVNKGYKCRIRKPWWKVPSVKTPDAILSVFGTAPRLIINDACWTFSNSLLGVYCKEGILADQFCYSWYSPLTLLSIELEIHSLGGGVLIAVPSEANKVVKIPYTASINYESDIRKALKSSDAKAAYFAGEKLLMNIIGNDLTTKIISSYEVLKDWRTKLDK